ncbi:hypothetical protein FN846DRAFT_201122 [Sphaerosporella brunnea]|uniref:Uncharacterized protein n=1 Tax=Sphaerosporella brunnea TaxID=1250544 RepID=A0A5J5EN26_9PEZI|nr:hypothetical protein FN846DRAFT_201122 [Sphaerosporella brunnea]
MLRPFSTSARAASDSVSNITRPQITRVNMARANTARPRTGPQRPPPRSATSRKPATPIKPSKSRFSSGSSSSSRRDRGERATAAAAQDADIPQIPVGEETAYTPAEPSVDSLLPDVPATPLTAAGLSSALIRQTDALGLRPVGRREGVLSCWEGYQRRRDHWKRVVVDGVYEPMLRGEAVEAGTIAAEARRLLVKNGTLANASKMEVLKSVKEMAGGVELPEPVQRARISA